MHRVVAEFLQQLRKDFPEFDNAINMRYDDNQYDLLIKKYEDVLLSSLFKVRKGDYKKRKVDRVVM